MPGMPPRVVGDEARRGCSDFVAEAPNPRAVKDL